MPTTATYSTTGNAYVDGVLSGIKWGVGSLTYSFPTSGSYYGTGYGSGENTKSFAALTSVQQATVKTVLGMFSAVANVTFTQVTETSSVHGDLRYAQSSLPGTAWAYYPSTAAEGGDAWFGNKYGYYASPDEGNYAWLTFIHETGHAMGLKHPHEVSGSFGALPTDKDSLEYTVMSYRSYVGASTSGGYTNGSTSYPQTLMMYDIAALQYMYGANYATNAGDTVYTWSATTGQMSLNGVGQGTPAGNKIFMTIWDGGGNDTYDFSNCTTGVTVDLSPGGWTTTAAAQLASLGSGKTAVGNIANALLYQGNTASLIENAIGGSGADKLTGNVADNKLTGKGGNDVLDGAAGDDTAVFTGASSSYSWLENSDGSWTITDLRGGSPDGVDLLKNIEYLQFTDGTTAIGDGGSTEPPDPPDPPVDTNTAPVAVNDSYSVAKNKKLTAKTSVLANDSDADGDAMTATLVTGPSSGTLAFKSNGTFTYTPARNFTGTVTFTYTAGDGSDLSNTATVTIAVTGTTRTNRWGAAETHAADVTQDQLPAPVGEKFVFAETDIWDADRAVDQVSLLLSRFGHASHDGGQAPADDDGVIVDGIGLPGLLEHHGSDWHLA